MSATKKNRTIVLTYWNDDTVTQSKAMSQLAARRSAGFMRGLTNVREAVAIDIERAATRRAKEECVSC